MAAPTIAICAKTHGNTKVLEKLVSDVRGHVDKIILAVQPGSVDLPTAIKGLIAGTVCLQSTDFDEKSRKSNAPQKDWLNTSKSSIGT